MAGLLCHLHFWTRHPLAPTAVLHTGIHGYNHKSTGTKVDAEVCRKEWSEGRNVLWSLPNHRPIKLKEQLRECEEMLSSQRILCVKWRTLRHFMVLLESGTLLLFTVSKHSGDIESILIDRSLITRIDAPLNRALILETSIILLYAEDNRVGVVYTSQGRRGNSAGNITPTPLTLNHENIKRGIEKMSALDLKLCNICVKGMPDQRIDRNITTNNQKDLVAVWWQDVQEGGMQWSSLADGEPDNIAIIRIKSNGKLDVYARIQTLYNPVSVLFSKVHANLLYCAVRCEGDQTYELHSLECTGGTSNRLTIDASIVTSGNVTACSMNRDESFLLMGCDNGEMVMYDVKKDLIKSAKAFFSPITSISWHLAGGVAFVLGLHGEMQCVDLSLNSLQFSVCNEEGVQTPLLELGSYFMAPMLLEHVGWGSEPRQGEGHGGCYDNFIAVFSKGPILLMRIELGVASKGKLGMTELLCEYLRHKQFDQAHDLLLSVNCEGSPQEWFTLLTIFIDHLLLLPLSPQIEEIIESVLSCCMSRNTEFKKEAEMATRRFFFKLLHNQRFEKAFRLALDLSAQDIFMDLHYMALRYNETALAELSLKKAQSLTAAIPAEPENREDENGNGQVISNPVLTSQDSVSSPVEETTMQIHQQFSEEVLGKLEDLVIKNPGITSSPQKDQVNVIDFGYFS